MASALPLIGQSLQADMPVNFPSTLTPSSRSFTPPSWPMSTATSQSGVVTRRLWGSLPSGASLQLNYQNISDTDVELFVERWNDSKGGFDYLGNIVNTHPIFGGMELVLKDEILSQTSGARWYMERPQITSVVPGISNMAITLRAELRVT